jgi:hypothetical protein
MFLGGQVMPAAHGGVLVRRANTRLPCGRGCYSIISRRKRKDGRCTVRAQFAHRREFGNPVREGNEVKDAAEGPALGIAVESYDNYMLPVGVYCFRNERHEIPKELGLFDNDQARLLVFRCIQQWHQGPRGNGGAPLLVVVHYVVRAIAGITGVGNHADGPAEGPVPPDNGKECRGLAGEHRTEKQFKTHCVGVKDLIARPATSILPTVHK